MTGTEDRLIFVNPAGQRDNLGDSALRRAYLQSLRKMGTLHVLAGRDESYATGLGLQEDDRVYTERSRWFRGALQAAARGRADFALNAGEVAGERREFWKSWWQVLLSLVVKLRGGSVVMTGVSVRPGTPVAMTHLRRLSRIADVVTWRDRRTMDAVGRGNAVPDWAFALGSLEPSGVPDIRKTIAVSMRGDRPRPSDEWIAAVRDFADDKDARLVVVVQVERDAHRSEELARLLDADLLVWPEGMTHEQQEERVRAAYRTCKAVLSDRIHALIFGYTEGAIPVGVSTTSPEKISRTFSLVTDLPVAPMDGVDDRARWSHLVESGSELAGALRSTRRSIGDLQAQLIQSSRT
ncbi:polysaccharide pyruvyl transferase family protein [Xylanimonas sp. McL0601]|uniref:polysaccharide pyruvyl transferase family protein n=1 Tax=Xylanimonas sp. McL0601 TaxID=3414739 RepID=UPI003CF086E8